MQVHGNYAEWRSDPELAKDYGIKKAADAAGMYNVCAGHQN